MSATIKRNVKYKGSQWTIADSKKIRFDDPTTTMPEIDYNFPVPHSDLWQWDTWCLRTEQGENATYNGWYIMFSLLAPRNHNVDINKDWNARHGKAFIGYFFSRDGLNWKYGGAVLKPGASKRPQQWAGCSILRNLTDNVDLFFTSVGSGQSVIAHSSAHIRTDNNRVWFVDGFDSVTDLFGPDGVIYATPGQNPYYSFRDPFFWVDKKSGEHYLLFEANEAGATNGHYVGPEETSYLPPGDVPTPDSSGKCAVIGIARLVSDFPHADYTKWEIMPPILKAIGTHDQLERPHIVEKNGLTYLFAIGHASYFSKNTKGPDGIYGYVSRDGLFGQYQPLNGSGLVLGNPTRQPKETYSHLVDSQGYVMSFIDTINDPQGTSRYRLGGTLAPTVKIEFVDDRTYLTKIYDYGQAFAPLHYNWTGRQDTSGFI